MSNFTKAFVYSHLGLGDMIWMNGAVRYIATQYEQTIVVCKYKNATNIHLMYSDDPSIILCAADDKDRVQCSLAHGPFLYPQDFLDRGIQYFTCGMKCGKPIYDLPNSFYDDFGLDRNIRTKYFRVPTYRLQSFLYQLAMVVGKYIIVHQESSTKTIDITQIIDIDNIFVIDINKNLYPIGHKYHKLANAFIGHPLVYYTTLIENAEELHLIESALYCLASHLNLSKVKTKICYFPYNNNAERLGIFQTGVLDGGSIIRA